MRSTIGITVSVRLSVALYIVALRVSVGVESCTITFLRQHFHFLFTSSDTFRPTVGYIV